VEVKPRGVANPGFLRMDADADAVAFVRGRTLTSWPSLKTDLVRV
jgi:hypothetical protein